MTENVQVSCIRKRDHKNQHERIQGLGGVHNGKAWYQPEDDIIAEIEKSAATRRWNYYTSVDRKSAWIIVAVRDGRKYLKTEADSSSRDNLLSLDDCP
jgi:hypothetical protein